MAITELATGTPGEQGAGGCPPLLEGLVPAARDSARIAVSRSADGIVEVTLPAGIDITEDQAIQATVEIFELTAGAPAAVLLDVTGVASISRDARRVAATMTGVAACAVRGRTAVDRVLGHFLFGEKVSNFPARYFSSDADARAWLKVHVSAR
ncbi:hypothetical protein KIH31_09410 [Paenarthrobacter sp. DKR-5]|uniref:DUF7793 family protein n=1 Tax=Paenarthrobacter sp. DKR-5 TaxID=2835535 RepID=UPI001BDC2BF8|nr:hypothetical protein [Paenarthrobacter sp. DKR-5]MBT1002822.1 hypothetical protein [Paenarthrobacter sp. DKR-5]